ncbi:MAG: hypothetical protein HY290_18705, partial [Planctomycetia bacterium]|nr:hypothetical protein [Planctomycetia bacterium]
MVKFRHECRSGMAVSSIAPGRRLSLGWLLRGLLAFHVFLIAGCSDGPAERLSKARSAFNSRDFEQAKSIAQTIPAGDPAWSNAQVLLGDIERSLGRNDAALRYYEAIPRDGSPSSLKGVQAIGEIHFSQCALAEAAECFEYVLEHRPDDAKTHTRLAYIYSHSGLRVRAQPHLWGPLKKGKLEVNYLVTLTAP